MISLLGVLVALTFVYFSASVYPFVRNLYHARASGLPYFMIPWDQNGFLWMAFSVPLRPYLQRVVPAWMWERMALTIYGFEFRERTQLFEQFNLSATAKADNAAGLPPKPRSYILVSPGKFEINTMEPAVVEQVLRRPRDFVPHDFTELFMSRFGPNVLTSEGEAWTRQRRLIAAVINERISRTVFAESVRHTEGLLGEVLHASPASGQAGAQEQGGETTRLFDMMKKITINVLSGAGMGASVEWHDHEEPQPGFRMTYIEGVKRVIDAVAGPIILPRWFLVNYPSFLPGHKMLHELSYALDEFPTHTRHLLDKERQRSGAAGGETRSNIMSQLLQATEREKKAGELTLSEDELVGNLFIFTAAGFDTTANTLSYALVMLARYPEWQQWMCEEIDAIMPADPDAALEYMALFPRATRVMALMLETLRLFPPVIHVAKMTRTPQTIHTPTTTYHLPAKTTVYLNTVCLHVDAAVWRNVNLAAGERASDTDELVFRPTRWINPPSSDGQPLFQPPKGSYIPWSSGPRICPGQKMAQVEFTSIFLTLFRRHRVEAVPLTVGGQLETRPQLDARLDARLKDSISILTLQMNDVYNVAEGDAKGLKLRLMTR